MARFSAGKPASPRAGPASALAVDQHPSRRPSGDAGQERAGPVESEQRRGPRLDPDALDPLVRSLARAPLPVAPLSAPLPAGATAPPAAPDLPELLQLEQLVRRLSWGGDGRRGSARIELGAGRLAGCTVVLHAEGRHVSLQLSTPPGVCEQQWRKRLVERLRGRGLEVSDDESP